MSLSSNTMGVTSAADAAYPSGTFEFTRVFSWVCVAQSLIFCRICCPFTLAIVLSVILNRFEVSNYLFTSPHLIFPLHHLRPWCTASICLCLWLLSLLVTSLFVSVFGYCVYSWRACLSLSLATLFTLDELVCLCLWLLSLLLTSLFVSVFGYCLYSWRACLSLSLATLFTLDELVCLCLWLLSSLLTILFVSVFGYCLYSW
jgi:hypothetical protein